MVCDKVVCVKDGVSQMVGPRCPARPSGVSGVPQSCVANDRVSKMVAQCRKCHACHMKRRCMSPSPTPATRNEGGCHQAPRLPRKVPKHQGATDPSPSAPAEPAQLHKWRKPVTGDQVHVPSRASARASQSAISASPATNPSAKAPPEPAQCHQVPTPATWNEGGCHQVPHLPRKVLRRHRRLIPATKRATWASPVP